MLIKNPTTHTLLAGRPGSGKTSFADIIHRQLAREVVTLACCVKQDEAARIKAIVPDAVMFSPDSGLVFNPLTHAMQRGDLLGLVSKHDDLAEMLTRSSSEHTETFWKAGSQEAMKAACELVYLVKQAKATYQDCVDVLLSAPLRPVSSDDSVFVQTPCGQMLKRAFDIAPQKAKPLAQFFMYRLPNVGEKAAMGWLSPAITSFQPFTTPPLCNALNGESTITPEDMLTKSTILNFDTMTNGDNGVAFQLFILWHVFEALLRRTSWAKPLLVVRDEYPQLCHPRRDAQAMAVGRSQGLAALDCIQSIPLLEDALGGDMEAQVKAKAIVGLHSNRIWCNNTCHHTNEYAAESLGKERKLFFGGATADYGDPSTARDWDFFGVGKRPSFSFNQQFHYRWEPAKFLTLRTGGKQFNGCIDGLLHSGGADFEVVTIRR